MLRAIRFCVVIACLSGTAVAQSVPLVDHHQHLLSPAVAGMLSQPFPAPPRTPITADHLIAHLDEAGIERAVVLSSAYLWSQPARKIADDYPLVRAENGLFGLTQVPK